VAEFWREHAVSRDTFYKYVTRFRAEGTDRFTRRSTAPHHRLTTLSRWWPRRCCTRKELHRAALQRVQFCDSGVLAERGDL
jgi:transposase IS481 family protein